MGSYLSCCYGSKDVEKGSEGISKNLKKGSILYKAAHMTQTASGLSITRVVVKKLATIADQEKVKNNPNTAPDLKLILSEPLCLVDKITENLYLTGIGGLNRENFAKHKISCVINATYEAPQLHIEGIECIRVPVDDSVDNDLSQYLDEVSDKIQEVAQNNGRTLVHCVAGISRSSTLVIAYLMKYQKMTLRNAFTYVKDRRDKSKPNPAFFQQLAHYEKKLCGKNSVKMIQISRDGVQVVVPDFYEKDYPQLLMIDIEAAKNMKLPKSSSKLQSQCSTEADDFTEPDLHSDK